MKPPLDHYKHHTPPEDLLYLISMMFAREVNPEKHF